MARRGKHDTPLHGPRVRRASGAPEHFAGAFRLLQAQRRSALMRSADVHPDGVFHSSKPASFRAMRRELAS